MSIEYNKIDAVILSKLTDKYGEQRGVKIGDDTFPLAAMDGDIPIGFVCVTPQVLAYPLGRYKDAYIEILWVDEDYRRQGIGQRLVLRCEEWARKAGFRQIRTHSNNKAVEAIHMWHKLNYGLCEHDYHEFMPDTNGYKNQFSGYWVAKPLNPIVPFSDKPDEVIRAWKRRHAYMYDADHGDCGDVELALDLIGPEPQNIFEACCGTGRVLVPLAKAGHNATGMDADEFMLDRIPAKAKGLTNLKYTQADIFTADWGNNYDVVILTSNTIMNLEHRDDDKAAQRFVIHKAAEALKQGGRFFLVYDYYPEPEKIFNNEPNKNFGPDKIGKTDDMGVSGQNYFAGARYNPYSRVAVMNWHQEITMPDGKKYIFPTQDHKYVCSRDDVLGWLSEAGFVADEEFGGCDRRPFTGKLGWDIIWARKL